MGYARFGGRRAVLLGAVLVAVIGVVGYGATAMAQEKPEEQKPAAPELKEEVTVTGTLIPRPTLEALSPVSTLEVEELSYQGVTRLEDFLTNLPQVFRSQNTTIANAPSGTATIDLRFLGAQRTLVLIDGRRMPVGDAGGLAGASAIAPDLNFIPAALVKRIDVLTGGASSVYGADAVAGVVNFILDRDFEGAKMGVSGGIYQHNNNDDFAQAINHDRGFPVPSGDAWDGGQIDAFAAFGGKFAEGRGHATVYLDYRKTAGIFKNRRDYTNCSVSDLGDNGPVCAGSFTSPTGDFFTHDQIDYTLDVTGAGNTFRLFTPNDLYNFAASNYMQRPDQRYAAGGFLDYEWNKNFHAYADVMLMDDRTDAQIAPSGDFFVTDHINCDNPMLSPDQFQKICVTPYPGGLPADGMAELFIGRRNVEGGYRTDQLSHQSFRLVGGLKGEINKVWSYDVYGLDAETRVPETFINDMNSTRLQNSLIVDVIDPEGDPRDPANWQCRDATARAEGCAPWNIFQAGGVTQAALNYLNLSLVSNSDVRTQLWSAKVNGDLKDYGIAFPSAAEGVQVAVGLEYRKEFLNFSPDFAYQTGIGAGQGGPRPAVSGSYSVKEGYGELLIPIVQGARGAKNLSVELGYRTSDYDITGRWNTWKVQVGYAPIDSFKLRGGRNRATRSPNIFELFSPQAVQLATTATQDPCAGPTPSFTEEQCALTGVLPGQYGNIRANPASQYNVLAGGNPHLQPEIADTDTAGIVVTPKGLPGLTAAFDYYNIKLKETIGSLGADTVIKACLTSGNPQLCSLIHRDSLGTLWLTPDGFTITTNQNIGELRAEGIDANVSYVKPIGANVLSFNLIGTYLLKSFTDTGVFAYDCVGFVGNQCGQPSPKWRHLARATWEKDPFSVTLAWRFLGEVKVDAASSDPGLADPESIPLWKLNGSFRYPNFSWFDLAGTYKLGSHVKFTLGINNIFDKEPPLGAGFSPNDFGPGFFGAYDPYGRFIHASTVFNF